jgi:hypothetical protein
VLDLHLSCTHGVPVADMLAHSPPLPLTIDLQETYREMPAEDENSTKLALRERDRVHRIALDLPASSLRRLMAAMDGPFPVLDRLLISSGMNDENDLPGAFQAQHLRLLKLRGTSFQIRLLSTTTASLVTLALEDIPPPAYFPPGHLLTPLSHMPNLKELVIGFRNATPSRLITRQLIVNRDVTLPNLHRFLFRGVTAYLDYLLSRIKAPLLSKFEVFFFNQLAFTLPHLVQFLCASDNLGCNSVRVAFDTNAMDVMTVQDGKAGSGDRDPPLHVQVMSRSLDWQVQAAAEILRELSPVFSAVEKLTLSHLDQFTFGPVRHDEVDRSLWHKFLNPFNNVKTLRVQHELVEELACSLHSEDGERRLDLLPNLKEVEYSGRSDVGTSFASFIRERQEAGRPVGLRMIDTLPFLTWT